MRWFGKNASVFLYAASKIAVSRWVRREAVKVEALTLADYEMVIREARSRAVMGGGIYDSLHATFARRKRAVTIVTRNPSHFQHVAPDIEILTP